MIRIFKHYMPKALLYLGVVEALILLLALYMGVSVRFPGDTIEEVAALHSLLPNAVIFVLVMVGIMTALGLYQREIKEGEWGYFPRLGLSLIAGLGVMSAIFYVVPSLSLGRGGVALTFLFAVAGLSLARLSYLKLSEIRAIRKRVLVLGTGSRARAVGTLAESGAAMDFQVVGYVPIAPADARTGAQVIAEPARLGELVKQLRVEEIVVAVRDRRGVWPAQELLRCKLDGVRVTDLPAFFERETGRIQLETLNTSWLIFSDGFTQGLVKTLAKRAFDLAASLALLALVWPLMLLAAALIYREDRGPVLYRQERVGQDGGLFTLVKFRSMRMDAERDGTPQWAKRDDERVTRIGRVLRKIRVDELPQLFNVLRGEMSFVGPRPERPHFVQELSRQIPFYNCRHTVKPGITGWAQVRYRYGASVEDAIEKLQYDLYYVKNNSIFLDLVILLQTAQVLVWNDGAR